VPIGRRSVLAGLAAAGLEPAYAAAHAGAPRFRTADAAWQGAYDRALAALAGNVRTLPQYDRPLLIEGSSYNGIWMECGPYEALVWRRFRPDIARNSHMAFFALQKADGQIPANIKPAGLQFGQIQMVVPIAATAWELARATKDEALLKAAYDSCGRWDAWLGRWRNTRGTGLVEGFCTYDTGMDNSPRWEGVPVRCPDADARKLPAAPGLPRLCPDLSATVYGARTALASMAQALGRKQEAAAWRQSAERLRGLILSRLYDAADAGFYDLDAQDRPVKIDCDVLSRVCGEHVVDRALFDHLWAQRLHDRTGFWAPYPLPSVALDDPKFVRPIPPNSWGGASQALTALRAPRWMEHYGRAAELAVLMQRWCEAIIRDGGFRQQLDPLSGVFTAGEDPTYSPAALALVDFTWRLAGVREEDGRLTWTVRPGCAAAEGASFALPLAGGVEARLRYHGGGAELSLGRRPVARIEGGAARLTTDLSGRPLRLEGVAERAQHVSLRLPHSRRRITLTPNRSVAL
jgi:hypothetical protein